MLQSDQHRGLLRGLFWAIPFWAIVMATNLELTDGEAYLWVLAKNLGATPYEFWPLPAWITALFTNALGDEAWALRLPALLARSAALGYFVVWCSDRWAYSVAKRSLWILIGTVASIAGAVIATPAAYFALFAMGTIVFADRRRPIATGVYATLALLCSPQAVALLPGIIWAFSTRRRGGPRWLALIGSLFTMVLLILPLWLAGWLPPTILAPLGGVASTSQELTWLGGSLLITAGPALLGALAVTLFIVIRRGFGSPILGYNRSESVRVPLSYWIVPPLLWHVMCAVRGEFLLHEAGFVLFPLCASIGALLNFSARDQELRFEWKMLLLSLGTMTMVSVLLLYPIAAWWPGAEQPNIASPRGALIGWKAWAQTMERQNLRQPDVGFVGADYGLASQAAWGLELPTHQFAGLGSPKQFAHWPSPLTTSFNTYVLFSDDRHANDLKVLSEFCAHSLAWQSQEIFLKGHVVKRIQWAACLERTR